MPRVDLSCLCPVTFVVEFCWFKPCYAEGSGQLRPYKSHLLQLQKQKNVSKKNKNNPLPALSLPLYRSTLLRIHSEFCVLGCFGRCYFDVVWRCHRYRLSLRCSAWQQITMNISSSTLGWWYATRKSVGFQRICSTRFKRRGEIFSCTGCSR